MIIVIVNREWNKQKNRYELIISHGVDEDTLENVVLPQVPVWMINDIKFNSKLEEYVLE